MEKKGIEEREITKKNGFGMLFLALFGFLAAAAVMLRPVFLGINPDEKPGLVALHLVAGGILILIFAIVCGGLHILNPNEAMVFTLFGKYYGTIRREGFYFTNPFCSVLKPGAEEAPVTDGKTGTAPAKTPKNKVSLKTMTLHNAKQKVNDALGNPVIIGAIVIWRVTDPTKALLEVDNYQTYLSTQCDSIIRNAARLYPYDFMGEHENEDEEHEKTLRGSSQEIAEGMKLELNERVAVAGIEVEEVRITHLSYAEEIAAVMLQRQQATAIIAARKKIVEGAVSMVDMAIEELSEKEVVVLDEERKAAMVSNLLVVLCGHQEAQPVVNSGSIY
ncbi:MAG: SPFH domain-containing protein [Lachnospiraceae bacterium]|nr:SPFH domain-containing protein [Lachnospiraceae bacterium]